MNTTVQRKITVMLEPGVGGLADEYIAAVNQRIKPGTLSLTSLISAAIREYVGAHLAEYASPQEAA